MKNYSEFYLRLHRRIIDLYTPLGIFELESQGSFPLTVGMILALSILGQVAKTKGA